MLGLAGGVALAHSDYEILLKRYARYLYPLNIFLLLIVLSHFGGHEAKGASRWIKLGPFELQPSEFAKIILITTLALFLAQHEQTITEWRTLLNHWCISACRCC